MTSRSNILTACAVLLAAAPARADDATAKALFDQGKTLFAEGKYGEACAKLEGSFKLNPLSGTRGLLAACYEKIGKLASAWAAYRDSAAIAERQGNADRAAAAREKAAELEPRLAHVAFDAKAVAKVPNIEIAIDGVVQPAAALDGTPLPVDAGQHLIEARATDYHPWKQTLDIADGENQKLVVAALVEDPTRKNLIAARITEERDMIRRRKRVAYVLAGGGAIALGASAVLAITARGIWNDAKSAGCTDDGDCPDRASADLVDRAASRANYASIFGIAGLALVGTAAFVYILTPSPHVEQELKLSPLATPSSVGLTLQGRF